MNPWNNNCGQNSQIPTDLTPQCLCRAHPAAQHARCQSPHCRMGHPSLHTLLSFGPCGFMVVSSHYPLPVIKLPASKTSLLHTHRANVQPNPAKPQRPSRIIRTPKHQPLKQSSVMLLTFQEAHFGAETPSQVLIHMEQPCLWQHCSSHEKLPAEAWPW